MLLQTSCSNTLLGASRSILLLQKHPNYDLPIALAILASSGQLCQGEIEKAAFAEELALDGSVHPVKGAVIIAEAVQKEGFTHLYIPSANVRASKFHQMGRYYRG